MKKAIIFDLDNTIYGVRTIGDELFAALLQVIKESGKHDHQFDLVKVDIMRKPFQTIAATYAFDDTLTKQGINMLSNLTYKGPIRYFDDYETTRQLSIDKYLVTTGFLLLQQSKIGGMNIAQDFKEIHIIDPTTSAKTKKDVFADILQRNNYQNNDVLVIGDDLHSEIKAAQDLNIDAVIYDKYDLCSENTTLPKIKDFNNLINYL